MELVCFQFTKVRELVLSAIYDENYTEKVHYNKFVDKVMESDFYCLLSEDRGIELNAKKG